MERFPRSIISVKAQVEQASEWLRLQAAAQQGGEEQQRWHDEKAATDAQKTGHHPHPGAGHEPHLLGSRGRVWRWRGRRRLWYRWRPKQASSSPERDTAEQQDSPEPSAATRVNPAHNASVSFLSHFDAPCNGMATLTAPRRSLSR